MAGGILFLGQAVAGASETGATATGEIASVTAGGEGMEGGDADSTSAQDVTAENNVATIATSGDVHAGGGASVVDVAAGNGNTLDAASDDGDVDATQDVSTETDVTSAATGGHVSGVHTSAGDGAGHDAHASGDIDSVTTGGDGEEGGDADSANAQTVSSGNNVLNDALSGDVTAGGGTSVIEVIAGNGNEVYCWSDEGDVTCEQNITTIINIISLATGGEVSCVTTSAGSTPSYVCTHKPAEQPAHQPAAQPVHQPAHQPAAQPVHQPAHQPAAQPVHHAAAAPVHAVKAAPAAHRAPKQHKASASASAQPAGELAYTGSEVSAPLTLGLVALGLGGAMTLAGRRRTTATA